MRKNRIKHILTFLIIVNIIMVQSTSTVKGAAMIDVNAQEQPLSQIQENINVIQGETETIEIENSKTEETTIIKATELDLGEYQTKMAVGDKQLLTVTVLPLNSTEQTICYNSDNKKVAEINGMGRITAKAVGTAKITVSCGSASDSFQLSVVETLEDESEKIAVTDVEISNYEKELEVNKTMPLSVTVVPANATENTVTYLSSNPQIATVNSSGEVKGIAKGDVIIYCSSGGITREAFITVKVATTKLTVNEDYLVMKPGENFPLKTEVKPAEAIQSVTYQSANTEIAMVSTEGIVTAKDCGSTNIIISNGDCSISVSVIVNETGKVAEAVNRMDKSRERKKKIYPERINTSEVFVVTREMLKYYYQNKELLHIFGDGYVLLIDGNKICNYENKLWTQISFEKTSEGVTFEINRSEELCGEIELKLEQYTGNYLYLYNESKDKYQLLEIEDLSNLHLTQSGRYLLTKKKISNIRIKKVVFAGSGIVLAGLLLVYIGVKKKYWFW